MLPVTGVIPKLPPKPEQAGEGSRGQTKPPQQGLQELIQELTLQPLPRLLSVCGEDLSRGGDSPPSLSPDRNRLVQTPSPPMWWI